MPTSAAGDARTVLVTGGVRSGKSTHAERLLVEEPSVVYVAPGPVPDVEQDPDWAARIDAHRSRRPAHWQTIEGHDLAGALAAADADGVTAVLVDCLGTWLTSVIDDAGAWEESSEAVHELALGALAPVVEAVRSQRSRVVLVTNEVGWGVVPVHRSGRLFRDLLGTVNQRVAAAVDEVHLVVSGRVLVL